METNSITNR